MYTTLYVSFVILYRMYTGARENDFTAGGYDGLHRPEPGGQPGAATAAVVRDRLGDV